MDCKAQEQVLFQLTLCKLLHPKGFKTIVPMPSHLDVGCAGLTDVEHSILDLLLHVHLLLAGGGEEGSTSNLKSPARLLSQASKGTAAQNRINRIYQASHCYSEICQALVPYCMSSPALSDQALCLT